MHLEEKYPFIASWIRDGQIQVGQFESWEPMAVVIDAGGIIWQVDEEFASLDELFDQMELVIGLWCRQHGLELVDRKGDVIPWPEDD